MAPRAFTLNSVDSPVSSNLIEILVRASRIRRSRISREVTRSPSLPAIGPSFTEKVIETVGGSISTKGKVSASSLLARVSPISSSSSPAIPTILPATASVASCVARAEYSKTLETFPRIGFWSLCNRQMGSPTFTRPDSTLPIPILPT